MATTLQRVQRRRDVTDVDEVRYGGSPSHVNPKNKKEMHFVSNRNILTPEQRHTHTHTKTAICLFFSVSLLAHLCWWECSRIQLLKRQVKRPKKKKTETKHKEKVN